LKNRQLQGKPNTDKVFADNLSEFENSAMVELGRAKETQVVSEFMIAHEKHEQKVIIHKGATETSIQKRKLNDELNIRKEIPNVDEELLTEVDEAKIKPGWKYPRNQ
jgi:selenocysteine-specific translation elongation factor